MNSEKRLRGTPRCGEAADVEVVLNFHVPVRVSPRLPGTRQSFALLQIVARLYGRLPAHSVTHSLMQTMTTQSLSQSLG